MCGDLIAIASALAGLGALLYIGYRVWLALARNESIDVFPLLRPFCIGTCIILFPTLVIGGLDGVMRPIEQKTHEIMQNQLFDLKEFQKEKDRLRSDTKLRRITRLFISDEKLDRMLEGLGIGQNDLDTLSFMWDSPFNTHNMLTSIFRWLLEFLFNVTALIIDTIRVFYMIVLSVLGPIAFGISVFDGFQNTLVQWIARYIYVSLWLPVSDLFSAMLAKIQCLSLQKDLELMASDPFYMFDSNNMVYLAFLLIGIIGYCTIPTISSWIVQAGGFGTYNRKLTAQGNQLGGFVSGAAGAATGQAVLVAKGVQQSKK